MVEGLLFDVASIDVVNGVAKLHFLDVWVFVETEDGAIVAIDNLRSPRNVISDAFPFAITLTSDGVVFHRQSGIDTEAFVTIESGP